MWVSERERERESVWEWVSELERERENKHYWFTLSFFHPNPPFKKIFFRLNTVKKEKKFRQKHEFQFIGFERGQSYTLFLAYPKFFVSAKDPIIGM